MTAADKLAEEILHIGQMEKLSEVAKDIIFMRLNKQTIEYLFTKFYGIMRKHGIKQGTLDEKGRLQIANFEWTMAWRFFLTTIETQLNEKMILEVETPDDLEHY
jgi:hypothetical protein